VSRSLFPCLLRISVVVAQGNRVGMKPSPVGQPVHGEPWLMTDDGPFRQLPDPGNPTSSKELTSMDPARARPGLSPGLKALLISGYSEIPEGKHPWCGRGRLFSKSLFEVPPWRVQSGRHWGRQDRKSTATPDWGCYLHLPPAKGVSRRSLHFAPLSGTGLRADRVVSPGWTVQAKGGRELPSDPLQRPF